MAFTVIIKNYRKDKKKWAEKNMANVYIFVKMKIKKKIKVTILFNSQLFTDLIFSILV